MLAQGLLDLARAQESKIKTQMKTVAKISYSIRGQCFTHENFVAFM